MPTCSNHLARGPHTAVLWFPNKQHRAQWQIAQWARPSLCTSQACTWPIAMGALRLATAMPVWMAIHRATTPTTCLLSPHLLLEDKPNAPPDSPHRKSSDTPNKSRCSRASTTQNRAHLQVALQTMRIGPLSSQRLRSLNLRGAQGERPNVEWIDASSDVTCGRKRLQHRESLMHPVACATPCLLSMR